MNSNTPVIEINDLHYRYARAEAVSGLNFEVEPGRCYGFFGRNGAGKTTTIKCLLNLLRPERGQVRLFGLDPRRDEVAVKQRLAYVPDAVAFYPWMSISQHFGYLGSFRKHWNQKIETELLERFGLDPTRRVNSLSRGEKVQVALIGALCPEPELLILDEPTSGLDPLIRREFIRTVIGAYQDADPEHRTVFVSTHLISEFEGLIDVFTVIDRGRAILSMETEQARERFQRIRARFAGAPPKLEGNGFVEVSRDGREAEVITDGPTAPMLEQLERHHPEKIVTERLTLEEIFLVSLKMGGISHADPVV